MLLIVPLMISFTSAYIMRGLRLLIMYNPDSRQRWGSLLRERNFVKFQVAVIFAMETVLWSCVVKFGVTE